jgi:hypothetical protein
MERYVTVATAPPNSHWPEVRRFACDHVVAREFDDVCGRLSVAQHERSRRPDPQPSAQQVPAFVIGDDLCGQTVAAEPGNREVGAAPSSVGPAEEVV